MKKNRFEKALEEFNATGPHEPSGRTAEAIRDALKAQIEIHSFKRCEMGWLNDAMKLARTKPLMNVLILVYAMGVGNCLKAMRLDDKEKPRA